MTVRYRCDAPDCQAEAEGWAGRPEAPPPRWWEAEAVDGSDGPARVVGWTVHACSPEHLVAALAHALAVSG